MNGGITRKNEALAQQAETNIKDEINLNIERLREVMSENSERIAKIDSLIKQYQAQPELKEIELPGVTFVLISTVAWQSVKTTQAINYIKFDKVLFYSTFYDLFVIYKKQMDGFMYNEEIRVEKWNSREAVLELKKMSKIYEEINSTARQIEAFYDGNRDNLKE